jgi:hypothetical protein
MIISSIRTSCVGSHRPNFVPVHISVFCRQFIAYNINTCLHHDLFINNALLVSLNEIYTQLFINFLFRKEVSAYKQMRVLERYSSWGTASF